MIREMFVRIELGKVPTGNIRMQTIHEGGVVTHLRWEWAKQMSDSLLLLDINIEVSKHHNTSFGSDVFLATAELTRRHVTFHNVYAVFLIKGNTGYLIETDDIVLAY